MACRVIHGFGSSVCEALPAQIVNDIFFLHERGKRLGFYTVALCLGSTGPLYASYMLSGGNSWHLFFYVEFAFAMALLILAFFCVEESKYDRPKQSFETTTNKDSQVEKAETVAEINSGLSSSSGSAEIPPRKTFVQTLALWGKIDYESDFFMMIVRSFSYYIVPPVFWVVTTYGIYIGLAALVFNYTFPIKIMAPPYNWNPVSLLYKKYCDRPS
jgi:MFS family permease